MSRDKHKKLQRKLNSCFGDLTFLNLIILTLPAILLQDMGEYDSSRLHLFTYISNTCFFDIPVSTYSSTHLLKLAKYCYLIFSFVLLTADAVSIKFYKPSFFIMRSSAISFWLSSRISLWPELCLWTPHVKSIICHILPPSGHGE